MNTPPKFNSRYVCPGDSVEWEVGPLTLRATLHEDTDTKPTDYDCYSPEQIEAWRRDEWFFVGMVLSVSVGGHTLSEHAASLWGLEANLPGAANDYLSETAKELEAEALEVAEKALSETLAALSKARAQITEPAT